MNLNQWAIKWGVPFEAVEELRAVFGQRDALDFPPVPPAPDAKPENWVQGMLRVNAAKKYGARLWRNNVGAGRLENGSYVRWGLCNTSKELNAKVKSHDLVGIKPVLIEPCHVGHTIGQFYSREAKPQGWRYRGTPREVAQLAFAELVTALGGDAKITGNPEDV